MEKKIGMTTYNTRHELFALAVASGMPASQAYQAAGYSARGDSAKVNASRLLRKAQVRDRVDQLMAEAAKEFPVTKALLTRMLLEDRRVALERGQARQQVPLRSDWASSTASLSIPRRTTRSRLPHQVAQSPRCSTSRR